MDMALHLIPMFLELAENLNISHTAQRLGLSQPAVSRQLRSLEKSLGVSLFLRQSRGLALTPAGRQLKRELQPALESIRESLATSRQTSSSIEGAIVFGSLAELGQRVFVPLLLEFASLHSGVTLDVRLMTERDIARDVAEGVVGLGIATRIPTGESLRAHRVLTERVVALTGVSNKRNLEDHPHPQYVGYRHHDPLLLSFLRSLPGEERRLPTRISIAVNSHVSMIDAIEATSFYAVLPLRSAAAAIASGRVRLASEHELRNDVFLVLPDHEFQERRYIEVTKFLARRTREIEERDAPTGGGRKGSTRQHGV